MRVNLFSVPSYGSKVLWSEAVPGRADLNHVSKVALILTEFQYQNSLSSEHIQDVAYGSIFHSLPSFQ